MCPVCGYPGLEKPPRRLGGGGSYEICWSCGFEFGVTDEDKGFSYQYWRRIWVALGMPWDSQDIRPVPPDWDPANQLRSLLQSNTEGSEQDFAVSARSSWKPDGTDFLRSLPYIVGREATDNAAADLQGAIVCPICGYPGLGSSTSKLEQCSERGTTCPSCGFQFGVTDQVLGITVDEWRRYWSARGRHWARNDIHPEPPGWNPSAQFRAYLESVVAGRN